MMKKLMGLAAIAAASVGCDKIEPKYEFGYEDGPSKVEDTDIGHIAILKEVGTSNSYPVKAKVDRASQTMIVTGYNNNQPVKYEWNRCQGRDTYDKAIAKFSVNKENKRVDYVAIVYMDR